MVKFGDIFEHYKGGKYIFKGIIHPSSEKPKPLVKYIAHDYSVFHTELGVKIRVVEVESLDGSNGELYADNVDEYLVLYEAEDSGIKYARPIDMFFEHIVDEGILPVKRFELIEPEVKVYRKRPLDVKAMKWDGRNLPTAIEFCGKENLDVVHITGNYPGGKLKIRTMRGVLEAEIGDYIIKGTKGEVYPIKPEIFKEIYQEVE